MFFLNLIFSTIYSWGQKNISSERHMSSGAYWIYFSPLILLWIFIAGGQYYVGTDYPSYLDIFYGHGIEQFRNYGEFGFWGVVTVCNQIGLKGQFLFYLFYAIGTIFIFLFIKKSKLDYIWIFILLFITYTSLFNNQLNGLRQSISIYIGGYGALLIIEKKRLKGLAYIILSISLHLTSIIFFVFYLTPTVYKLITRKKMLLIMIISLILCMLLSPKILDNYIEILPIKYSELIKSGAVEKNNVINIISKLLFYPIYILSIINYNKLKISSFERTLYLWGIIGFAIRVSFLGLSLIGRIGMGFLLFSIFPLYYYLIYLKSKSKITFYILILFLIGYYFIKVVAFPVGEYNYNNIIFKEL